MFVGGFDEAGEEGVGLDGFAAELGVGLRGYEIGVIFQLNEFHEVAVGRCAAEDEIFGLELFAVGVVEFVSVAMAFADVLGVIKFGDFAFGRQFARLRAEAHGAAHFGHVLLLVEQSDDGVRRFWIELCGVRALQS